MTKKKASIYDSRPQKVSKRIAAWIVDFILLIILATGVAFATSAIIHYDVTLNVVEEKCNEYGVRYEETDLSGQGTGNWVYCDDRKDECIDKLKELYKDPVFINANRDRINGELIIATSAIIVPMIILEFVMPLILKHGRTIGMRFFDVGYVTDEGIEPPIKNIFIRFLFGKLILEGLIPVISIVYLLLGSGLGLFGIVALVAILVINGYLLLVHKDKRGIHDYISRMRPVDNSNQIYIKTSDELARLKAEEAMGKV